MIIKLDHYIVQPFMATSLSFKNRRHDLIAYLTSHGSIKRVKEHYEPLHYQIALQTYQKIGILNHELLTEN